MRIKPILEVKIPKKPCNHDNLSDADVEVDGIEIYCRKCSATLARWCFDCKGTGKYLDAEEVEHQCTSCHGYGWKPLF